MKDLIDQLRWAANQTFSDESAEIVLRAIDEIRLLRLEKTSSPPAYKPADETAEDDDYRSSIFDRPMADQQCGNCVFFVDDRCKRNPPAFHHDFPLGLHPLVPEDDWCGEWLPEEDASSD